MSDAESRIAAAYELHLAGRLAEALAGYDDVLRAAPDHPDALNLAGKAAGELGNHQRAWELFRAAIAAAPDFAEAHDNLGIMLATIGRHGEAADCHRRATELDADGARGFNNLGVALLEIGRTPEAAAALDRAAALEPDKMAIRFNLGRALHYSGRLDEAEAALRRVRRCAGVLVFQIYVARQSSRLIGGLQDKQVVPDNLRIIFSEVHFHLPGWSVCGFLVKRPRNAKLGSPHIAASSLAAEPSGNGTLRM